MNLDIQTLYPIGLIGLFCTAVVVFFILLFMSAPYGKFSRKGWGIQINSIRAWMIMELPAVLTIAICAWLFRKTIGMGWIFLIIWEFHYVYRTFIFPLLMKKGKQTFPVSMMLMAGVFNVWNGALNGIHLFLLRPVTQSWFLTPQFIIGLAIFMVGFLIHMDSDRHILVQKRQSDKYIIPHGGMFRLVSCPNYLGEIIQWFGWAVLTWSPAGLAFAVFTFANIFPRGILSHRWYQKTFDDYPAERKAIIPFLV